MVYATMTAIAIIIAIPTRTLKPHFANSFLRAIALRLSLLNLLALSIL